MPHFNEWIAEFNIKPELLLKFGPSQFIDHLPPNVKCAHLLKDAKGETGLIIENREMKDMLSLLWRAFGSKIDTDQKFLPYKDWCKAKNIFPLVKDTDSDSYSSVGIAEIQLRSRIWKDLELMQMSGIKVLPDQAGWIQGKEIEFADLKNCKFKGISTAFGNLTFRHCYLNNVVFDEIDELQHTSFENCVMKDVLIINSRIRLWKFVNCEVTGKITNSELSDVTILGGTFHPIIENAQFQDVNAEHGEKWSKDFKLTYQILKKVYADQGDDDRAIDFFIREKESQRRTLIQELPISGGLIRLFKVWKYGAKLHCKRAWALYWKYIRMSIAYFYWGYGRKPLRILFWSFTTIVLFGILNWLMGENNPTLIQSFSYSLRSFTNLGKDSHELVEGLEVLSNIESLLGFFNLGFLVAGLSNLKY